MRIQALLLAILALSTSTVADQRFDVLLRIDYESALRSIDLFGGLSGSPSQIAALRGSQIALETTALLAGRRLVTADLEEALQAAKFNQVSGDDVFEIAAGRTNLPELKELLEAVRQRNFGSKVVSTVAQLFPDDTNIRTTIPLYFVAFGHENIDAFVRRVRWQGDRPVFVGENEGELTIVVNLSKAVHYGRTVDERFIGLLSVVAHEVFHAAFGVYKDASSLWRDYYRAKRGYLDDLLDLTQNEGVAHYLSLIQRTGGRLRNDQVQKVQASFDEFNRVAALLHSGRISPQKAGEMIRHSNSSGYWESFGAITGMIVARQIDQSLGRTALLETIELGPDDFFRKYADLMRKDGGVPQLSDLVLEQVGSK
jgi:hypothetical protein